tara:strand:+ start:23 stop:406 length:384 start_codon:yes stop_codon:yes gene_type:complete
MQNNKSIKEEVSKNSNNVFMSEELDNLFDFSGNKVVESVKLRISFDNNNLESVLTSKMSFDNVILLKFTLSLEDIVRIESKGIDSLSYVFKDKVIKEYNNKSYAFDVSWCQQNNKYEVDIFINKRGE